jgi:hypothetical protein
MRLALCRIQGWGARELRREQLSQTRTFPELTLA